MSIDRSQYIRREQIELQRARATEPSPFKGHCADTLPILVGAVDRVAVDRVAMGGSGEEGRTEIGPACRILYVNYKRFREKAAFRAFLLWVRYSDYMECAGQLGHARKLVSTMGEAGKFVASQGSAIARLEGEKARSDRLAGDAIENSDKLEREKAGITTELMGVKKQLAAMKRQASVLGFQVKQFLKEKEVRVENSG